MLRACMVCGELYAVKGDVQSLRSPVIVCDSCGELEQTRCTGCGTETFICLLRDTPLGLFCEKCHHEYEKLLRGGAGKTKEELFRILIRGGHDDWELFSAYRDAVRAGQGFTVRRKSLAYRVHAGGDCYQLFCETNDGAVNWSVSYGEIEVLLAAMRKVAPLCKWRFLLKEE